MRLLPSAILLAALAPVASSAVASSAGAGGEPLFVERDGGALAGVTTTSGPSRDRKDWIVEVNGGGLVLGDFDGDGTVDLVVVDGSTLERAKAGEAGQPPRLFLGDGRLGFRDAAATDAREAAGASEAEERPSGSGSSAVPTHWAMAGGRWGMGGAAGDVDGDGDLDLCITEWGPDRLWLNDAGRGLDEVSDASGLARVDEWSTSAAFFDADRDGDLDLAVVTYLAFSPETVASRESGACKWKGHSVMCGPEGLEPTHDRFYRGRGDGTFEEATEAAGLRPERPGFGLGVLTLDADDDGDTDLYVTNDSTPNHLWLNDGAGKFEEHGFDRGVALDPNGKEQAGMGVTAGDVNGDGRQDLFVTNFSGESNALYGSGRTARFRERSDRMGIGGASKRWLGWGTGMHDLDLDGDLDLFVLNGHVYPEADRPGTDTQYAQPDQLYRNAGGQFAVEPLADGPERVSRTGAAADLDGDGDLDLVTFELNGRVRVLENRAARPGGPHWLEVRLRGERSNRHGIGARVEVRVGEAVRVAEVRTAGGYQSAVPAQVHFGLGELEPVAPAGGGAPAPPTASVVVRWPSGTRQVVPRVPLDGVLVVNEETE